jgi:hypothetical protein
MIVAQVLAWVALAAAQATGSSPGVVTLSKVPTQWPYELREVRGQEWTCIVRVTIDRSGMPTSYAPVKCDDRVAPSAGQAALLWRFNPVDETGPSERYQDIRSRLTQQKNKDGTTYTLDALDIKARTPLGPQGGVIQAKPGNCRLYFVLDTTGKPRQLKTLDGCPPEDIAASMHAIESWEFSPFLVDDVPTAVSVITTVPRD